MTSAVVSCGLTTVDVVQVVEHVPGPDEKVVAAQVRVAVGGPAANAALTVAALGARSVLVTALGTSPLADLARAELLAGGVEVVDVDDGDTPPPLSTVLVTAATGARAVVSTNYAAAERTLRPPSLEVLDGAGCVLVDGHLVGTASDLCVAARARGITTLLDGGSYKEGLTDLLPHLDAVVLSEDFTWPGTADDDLLAELAARGPVLVARSHGSDPIECLFMGATHTIEVPQVAEVVDTLGAGDVLHGALATHLARSRPWLVSLEDAAEVASGSVAHAGALGWAVPRTD